MPSSLPVVELADPEKLGTACREHGFFYLVGHGVDPALGERLETLSRAFFAQSLEAKLEYGMALGGRAWRGYFPPGGELTSGRPDLKEGLYFGEERPVDPRPMHGPNLFPSAELRDAVLAYIAAMTALGHRVMETLSLSLGLDAQYFHNRYTAAPLVLFRIFHYPAVPDAPPDAWGVGEHTDYGLLTMLRQDAVGGLEVKTPSGWIEATPMDDAFVCNLGDMLDKMTGGLYRSTPHRVRPAPRSRISMPFFFDPGFDTIVQPVRHALSDDADSRWDHASVHEFTGTYGDWLLAKVARVFPHLTRI